jgi:N-acetyl-alpha-D-muramate 1-phosphate uridylyltransferase
MEAMIFAAGLGSRLQDETANKPKALVDVGGKPLIQHAIEKLVNAGATKIVVNVHHFADVLTSFIENHHWEIQVQISNESEQLLETGGGLKKAAPFFSAKEAILIYNVDILSNLNLRVLYQSHLNSDALATLVVRNRKTSRYLKFDKDMHLTGWLNKTNGETKVARPEDFKQSKELAFSGIQVIQPELFEFFPTENRFSITDWYLELAKSKIIKGYFDESDLWMDVGKPAELEAARSLFRV